MCGGAILKSNGPPVQQRQTVYEKTRSVTEFDAFRYVVTEGSAKVIPSKEDSPSIDKTVPTTNLAANLATAISPTNLTFGYGRMSCPGRYFAVHSIKSIVVGLLLQYDIELEQARGLKSGRPKNIQAGNVTIPDPQVSVRFRSKQ
jgi:hypothetical protein